MIANTVHYKYISDNKFTFYKSYLQVPLMYICNETGFESLLILMLVKYVFVNTLLLKITFVCKFPRPKVDNRKSKGREIHKEKHPVFPK